MRHVVIVLLLALVSACAPTPKPFEHDTSEDQSYDRHEKTDVAIMPPANMPSELGDRVAAALAVELQAYGIVATLQSAKAPLQLSGTMSTRDAPSGFGIEIEIDWSLSGGKTVEGPATSKTIARSEDYAEATDRLVSRIAQQAAPQVATLMGHPPNYEARSLGQVMLGLNIPPASATSTSPDPLTKTAAAAGTADPAAKSPSSPGVPSGPPPPQVKVAVAPVTGAPSDGNRQLFSGMRRALGSSKVVVIDKAGADAFTVVCTVSLTPIDDRSVTLVVLWILKDPSGKEVGKVEQSNAVPTAATRGTWQGFGDIVADAAVEGILQLLDKALAKQP